jgi:ABC-type lipoprotein release transport system permease subunit
MFVPLKYNLRNLAVRRLSTVLTAFGIAVSVGVFIAVMALVEGIRATFVSTGEANNVLAIRNGAQAETGSLIEPDAALSVRSVKGVELASLERIIYVNLPRRTAGTSNVVIRGTGPAALQLRPAARLVRGRWFRPGSREVTVSSQIAERFVGCALDEDLVTGNARWRVVGIFDAGQTAYSSEIWTSAQDVQSVFRRPMYSVILVRTAQANDVINAMSAARLDLNARPERDYYADQTKAAAPIRVLGNVIAVIMAIGSAFAAMNSMYAAVASRVREVAVLRALGFSAGAVAASFLTEAAMVALIGGVLGGVMALPLNGIGTGTTNWFTFSEMNFRFAVTPLLLGEGVVFAVLMGVAGGVLPAIRASRLSPAAAMRAL